MESQKGPLWFSILEHPVSGSPEAPKHDRAEAGESFERLCCHSPVKMFPACVFSQVGSTFDPSLQPTFVYPIELRHTERRKCVFSD